MKARIEKTTRNLNVGDAVFLPSTFNYAFSSLPSASTLCILHAEIILPQQSVGCNIAIAYIFGIAILEHTYSSITIESETVEWESASITIESLES